MLGIKSKLFLVLYFLLFSMRHFFYVRVCGQYQVHDFHHKIDKHEEHLDAEHKIALDYHLAQVFLVILRNKILSFLFSYHLIYPRILILNFWRFVLNIYQSNAVYFVHSISGKNACHIAYKIYPHSTFYCFFFLRNFDSNLGSNIYDLPFLPQIYCHNVCNV